MTLLDDAATAVRSDLTGSELASSDPTSVHPSGSDPTGFDLVPARMIAIWCPDWPVAAAVAGAALDQPAPDDPISTTEEPVAVVTANHVVACSHPARIAGVRRGMRRREAQSRCPELTVLARDEAMEARTFEPLVAAIETIAPGVEITRPGLVALGARGPSRYFGSEDAVLHALSRTLSELSADVLIGVADGSFAAEQAARRGLVVPPGQSANFLAELPVEIIDAPELVDLLRRLGIRTLGSFADLPARDVLARFGPTGAWIHRQCGGRDARPIAARPPATEHTVDITFEPALDRIDSIAFSVRTSAERFINGLLDHGLACACLELIAETENGEQTARRWRQAGVLSAVDVVDRVRWQLEGWLNGLNGAGGPDGAGGADGGPGRRSTGERPTGGVNLVRLVAAQCVPTGVHQQSLWSASGDNDERAHRALARVQTLLGHGSVLTAVRDGGHDPAQRTTLVPWGNEPVAERGPEQPWPGHLASPAPSVLIEPPRVIRVLDAMGHPVTVTARGAVPVAPAQLDLNLGRHAAQPLAVTAWAGPWPVDDTWWSAELNTAGRDSAGRASAGRRSAGSTAGSTALQRRARFQLVDVSGRAYLVVCSFGVDADSATAASTASAVWTLEAVYD